MRRPSGRPPLPGLATVSSLIVPLVVLLLVWQPLLTHDAVAGAAVPEPMVASARVAPADAVLREIRDFDLLPIDGRTPETEIAVANGILAGRLQLPGRQPMPITLPFSPDDLDGLPASLWLPFAGYVVPDMLLAAFVDTGREAYLRLAREVIVAWDGYERSKPLSRGYLWNDHAISARVRVLSEFWQLYRQRPEYDADTGRIVLEQAARYGAFLADPGHFTFATNHGLMQNLALLELALAFPSLPDSARYQRLALDRLGQQLSFLVSPDGVVRENSAGYQAFGMALLGMIYRCMTLLGTPVPADWRAKYEAGLAFLARLERPDGSLPVIGDTDGSGRDGVIRVTDVDASGRSGPLHDWTGRQPDRAETIDPVSGYWVAWSGLAQWPIDTSLDQTVVTWTRPPSSSHKHADELNVLVWSQGVSWLTSVGYWPYEDQDRAAAESWAGANAPHLAGEPYDSQRTAGLLSAGTATGISAVEVERRGPGDYLARRLVVHLDPNLWVIVDRVETGGASTNETVWTMPSEVTARPGDTPGTYQLETPGGATAQLTVTGSAGTEIRSYRGSRSPFAGWQVSGSVPKPAPAIVVDQPPGTSWTVAVLSTASPGGPTADGSPTISGPNAAGDWAITVPTAGGVVEMSRVAGRITATGSTGMTNARSLDLSSVPDPAGETASLRQAFDQVAAAYPVFQVRASARTKVTGALGGLLVAQELLAWILRRRRRGLVVPFRVLTLGGWIILGALLQLVLLTSGQILVVS